MWSLDVHPTNASVRLAPTSNAVAIRVAFLTGASSRVASSGFRTFHELRQVVNHTLQPFQEFDF